MWRNRFGRGFGPRLTDYWWWWRSCCKLASKHVEK